MSKYNPLWDHIKNKGDLRLMLSFDEIQSILGFPIDHSFLNYKKELKEFGYEVEKISLKNKMIIFNRLT